MEKLEESVEGLLTQCCSGTGDVTNQEDECSVYMIQWEEFQNSLARLCGLATVLAKAQLRRKDLVEEIEGTIAMRSQTLERVDKLENLQKNLETRHNHLQDARIDLHDKSEKLSVRKKTLSESGNSLLHCAKNLSAAKSRVEEAGRMLAVKGYGRVSGLRKELSLRRRCMVAQVAALYPLVPCPNTQQCPPFAHTHHPSDGEDYCPMTIAGLHLIAPLKKMPSLFNDKSDYETSATALGYVAHVVSLLASYLDVRLRYPVRFGASRSYVQDLSPPQLPTSNGGAIVLPIHHQQIHFPLFSDGQDPTRAAYAVFLLNKDLEQILSHLGSQSIGPRHVLPNLQRVIRRVSEL